jgi:hypothetical protein
MRNSLLSISGVSAFIEGFLSLSPKASSPCLIEAPTASMFRWGCFADNSDRRFETATSDHARCSIT